MWRIKNSALHAVRCQKHEACSIKSGTGLTLIELLVTTSILGMIALAIFSTFAGGLRVFERVKTYGGVQADVLLSLEKMERDLRNVFNLKGIDFSGDAKEIAFAGLIREQGPWNRVQIGKISYYFDNETGTLVKEEQSYPEAISEGGEAENDFIVLSFIENINFSYYYFNSETQAYSWKSSWGAGGGIPRGVKIELTFKDSNKDVKLERTVFIPVAG